MNKQSYNEYMENHVNDCKRTGDVVVNGLVEMSFQNPKSNISLLMSLVGMQAELGEIVDILQKRVFYGLPTDVAALLEEMGDFLFYWDLLSAQLREELCCSQINDITIRDLNRKKRRLRFPEGYTPDAMVNKDRLKEREIFLKALMEGEGGDA